MALNQSFVWRREETDDDQPDRENEKDLQDAIQSLPDCGFAPRAKIAITQFHVSAS